ncbi:preprotein translocase subunit SecG [Patescibacteria group bacterium]|nr:preprotein translocase subunit SecG [Patescibacteria group bacterium]
MEKILSITQIIVSFLLIVGVLLQSRGGGLSSLMGGGGEVYHTKRGAEKIIFRTTIVLSVSFLVLGIVRLII